MDIHDIALKLYGQLIARPATDVYTDEGRLELAHEAYLFAEAYIRAKDQYIRNLPVREGAADY